MALTIKELRLAIAHLPDDLPVAFLHAVNHQLVADTVFSTGVIERDTKSHAPKTGRRIETSEVLLKGGNEPVFVLSDR